MKRSTPLRRYRRLRSVCPATGKRRFPTAETAQQILDTAKFWRDHGDERRHEQRVYACKTCEGFHLSSLPVPPKERPSSLPAMSVKRAKAQRQRTKMLKETFGNDPACAVPWCGRQADDAHEVLLRSRGGSIIDPANIRPLCRGHHDEITFRPESELGWAYDLGLLKHSWDSGEAS